MILQTHFEVTQKDNTERKLQHWYTTYNTVTQLTTLLHNLIMEQNGKNMAMTQQINSGDTPYNSRLKPSGKWSWTLRSLSEELLTYLQTWWMASLEDVFICWHTTGRTWWTASRGDVFICWHTPGRAWWTGKSGRCVHLLTYLQAWWMGKSGRCVHLLTYLQAWWTGKSGRCVHLLTYLQAWWTASRGDVFICWHTSRRDGRGSRGGLFIFAWSMSQKDNTVNTHQRFWLDRLGDRQDRLAGKQIR